MKMEVGRFLATVHTVVLKREYSEWLKRPDKRLRHSLCRTCYSCAFFVRQIEQSGNVAACNHAALTNLELPGVYDGERMIAFINDRPLIFATCHSFTEVTRVSDRKLDHCNPRPVPMLKEKPPQDSV